jgi:capsular polysaccharide biosynthesis protein
VGVVLAVDLTQTPMYEGTIRILVGKEQEANAPGSLGGDVQGLQQLTQTMAETLNSRTVANAVIEQLNLPVTSEDFLGKYLSVEQVRVTQLIEVRYRDPNPQTAQQVANTVGEVFSEQVSEVNPSGNPTTVTVWDRAELPDAPVSPNIFLSVGLALIVGLALGVGLAFLLEYLDDSWRAPEEVEQISGIPTIGVIPKHGLSRGAPLSSSSWRPKRRVSK